MSSGGISIRNLSKSYAEKVPVLEIASLDLHVGELTCILGPTGCGKTTLLNILAGNDNHFKGDVLWEIKAQRKVTYQPQKDLLLAWKTVRENILLGYSATGLMPPETSADKLLLSLDLLDVSEAYPSVLSAGMRQRVALGRTLAWDGRLKLFDEPLSAQDFKRRLSLETLLRHELRSQDSVSIVVTHNLEEAVALADRIIVLGGKPARILDDFRITGLGQIDRSSQARTTLEFSQYISRCIKALSNIFQSP